MTFVGHVNQDLSGGTTSRLPEHWYNSKEELINNRSWTAIASGSGNGGSYSASSDLITAASVWQNDNAWLVIQSPGANPYQILFQVAATDSQGRVWFSESASFSDPGSAGAEVRWTAPDECQIFGNTGAAATYFSGTNPYGHVVTSTVAENGAYPVYFFFTTAAGLSLIFGVDVVVANTKHPDMTNHVVGIASATQCRTSTRTLDSVPEIDYQTGEIAWIYGSAAAHVSIPDEPNSGNEAMFDFGWYMSGGFPSGSPWQSASTVGWTPGISKFMRLATTSGVTHTWPDRSNATTDGGSRVFISASTLIPWPDSTTPSI